MAFGAGRSAKLEARQARRISSPLRRYRGPVVIITAGVFASKHFGWMTYTEAIALGCVLLVAYVATIGQRNKAQIQEAKAKADRYKVGAKIEVKMGWHLLPLSISRRYRVLHDRVIFKHSRANVDHIVIGPNGVSIPDSKRRSGKAVWHVLGSDLLYRGQSIRHQVETTSAEADEIRKALRRKFDFEVPVRAAWGVWPHMRLEREGKITGKIVADVAILPFRAIRRWCRQGPVVLSQKQIKEVGNYLNERFPPATAGRR